MDGVKIGYLKEEVPRFASDLKSGVGVLGQQSARHESDAVIYAGNHLWVKGNPDGWRWTSKTKEELSAMKFRHLDNWQLSNIAVLQAIILKKAENDSGQQIYMRVVSFDG